jgi:integrase
MKKLRESAERVRSLSTAEESRLLGKLNVWAGRVTRVALLTGMRQGELLSLRKTAVDLQHGTVTLADTKNGEPRPVYLNAEAATIVREAMAASPGDHVFVSRARRPYTSDGFRSVFRRARERAKVQDFRFHDTRHTTATRLRRANVGLDAVAKALGHKSLRMTTRYAHIEPITMRAAMAALPPLATATVADSPAEPLDATGTG